MLVSRGATVNTVIPIGTNGTKGDVAGLVQVMRDLNLDVAEWREDVIPPTLANGYDPSDPEEEDDESWVLLVMPHLADVRALVAIANSQGEVETPTWEFQLRVDRSDRELTTDVFFPAHDVLSLVSATMIERGFRRAGEHLAGNATRAALERAERGVVEGSGRHAPLALPLVWDVTHKRLDHYHALASRQAKLSFYSAQVAMAVGFILLVGFTVLALNAPTPTGSVVTGALGVTATAFAAYISRTFVRSQETTASHLREYFKQPVEFSRFLAAERLLASFQEAGREVDVAEVLRVVCSPESRSPGTE
jgi:uncharacterized membrane protein (DUF485 family)